MSVEAIAELLPIGEEIDHLWKLREDIRVLEDKIKEKKAVLEEKSDALMARLRTEGMDMARGQRATVSIKETVVPQVENWDEYYRFIRRNNAFHLLERRAAAAPYRELLEDRKGKPIPGVVPWTKRTLNLRTA